VRAQRLVLVLVLVRAVQEERAREARVVAVLWC
jgi:hypothetical protein